MNRVAAESVAGSEAVDGFYSSLAESPLLAVVSYTVEPDGGFVIANANRRFLEITGMDMFQAKGGRPESLFADATARAVLSSLKACLISGKALGCEEEVAFSGKPRLLHSSYHPLRVNGIVQNIIAVSSDISEVRAARQQVAKAQMEAGLAARCRSEFLSSMSHEFRTPLNAIIGFAEVMKAQLLGPIENPKYLNYLENIAESGHTLLRMVNDVLEVSTLDISLARLREDECDLEAIVSDAVEAIQPRARSKHIALRRFAAADELPLKGDRKKLRQALGNLLSNAVKFTPEGGAVEIATGISRRGDLTICITDTGIGMDPQETAAITEAFRQLGEPYSRGQNGVGLGLTIAKAFVDLHNGALAIESRKNAGTTVTMTLPARRRLHSGAYAHTAAPLSEAV